MATPTPMGVEGTQYYASSSEDKERNPTHEKDEITNKAQDFGAVINRILYKLDALVRPYAHKIFVVIELLLIDDYYFARCVNDEIINKRKRLNPKDKVQVDEIRNLLNGFSKKPETFVGFLVSNLPLSDYSHKELDDPKIKHRICACFFYEIVDKKQKSSKIGSKILTMNSLEEQKSSDRIENLDDEFLRETKKLKDRIEDLEKKDRKLTKEFNE
ncbi:1217_t:CDS:2 [Cetraspora pellucida]|uniref:1217_t:CDS:1 n=1 Tax=Cetraspora pellucida TaxID=1433469 RepID=A0A9N9HJ94_9GLOM|nr:1217_t:CDS:2 [Cetraspora pellucida]